MKINHTICPHCYPALAEDIPLDVKYLRGVKCQTCGWNTIRFQTEVLKGYDGK